jgi:hypothetical protein
LGERRGLMASLVELPELVGFFSYSRNDDRNSEGALSRLRERIQKELHLQLGRELRLFQDSEAIPSGALWERRITEAVDASVFFIPIVTPSAIASSYCKFEFKAFLEREATLGRNDLIFPILYIRVPMLEREELWRQDDLLGIVGARQYMDWQKYRHRNVGSAEVAERIEQFCSNISEALRRSWLSPEERRSREEAEAAERAAEEQRRLEAEAKQREKEEERQKQLQAEAYKRAEEQRQRQEAEAKRRAEEQVRQRQLEADALKRAEEDRQRREAAAKQREDELARRKEAQAESSRSAEEERQRREAEALKREKQWRAFEAAKRSNSLAEISAFVASHPDSHLADEARELGAMLAARDKAHQEAMASNDPAVLRAFIKCYPESAAAGEVRARLLRLEPPKMWWLWPVVIAGGVAVALLIDWAIGK